MRAAWRSTSSANNAFRAFAARVVETQFIAGISDDASSRKIGCRISAKQIQRVREQFAPKNGSNPSRPTPPNWPRPRRGLPKRRRKAPWFALPNLRRLLHTSHSLRPKQERPRAESNRQSSHRTAPAGLEKNHAIDFSHQRSVIERPSAPFQFVRWKHLPRWQDRPNWPTTANKRCFARQSQNWFPKLHPPTSGQRPGNRG